MFSTQDWETWFWVVKSLIIDLITVGAENLRDNHRWENDIACESQAKAELENAT